VLEVKRSQSEGKAGNNLQLTYATTSISSVLEVKRCQSEGKAGNNLQLT